MIKLTSVEFGVKIRGNNNLIGRIVQKKIEYKPTGTIMSVLKKTHKKTDIDSEIRNVYSGKTDI